MSAMARKMTGKFYRKKLSGKDLDALLALASAAGELDKFLAANVGHTVEWPIQIAASTEKDFPTAKRLAELLQDLRNALKDAKAKPSIAREIMGWQARHMEG
jgi:hypothetical protein